MTRTSEPKTNTAQPPRPSYGIVISEGTTTSVSIPGVRRRRAA